MTFSHKTLLQYIGVLISCALLSGCTQLFFYPMKPHLTEPGALGYDYQDIQLRADDGTQLHAWLIEPNKPYTGTVYFLHGNAENISTHVYATLWLLEHGYQVFALDYRGYGLSEGTPNVPEVFMDIEAGAQWIEAHVRGDSIERTKPLFLFGQSLGASLAITFAQRYAPFEQHFDGLITEAAFARFDTIARYIASTHWLTWAAQYPAQWFIRRQYDPLDAITELDGIPKLLIHSPEDTIIPYRFGQALFAAAPPPKQWLEARGPHIRGVTQANVRDTMLQFMQQYGTQAK